MQTRMQHPAVIIPEAMEALKSLLAASHKGGVPPATLQLVGLRVSQINGCSHCLDDGLRYAKKAGLSEDKLFSVVAWRHTPYFTAAERAALALAEAVTRFSDRTDPVPDEIWGEAARHFDERGLAALLLAISTMNVFNRLNSTIGLIAGTPVPWD